MTNDKQKDRLVELIGEELLNYSSWSTEMALQGTYEMPSAEEVIADKLLADGWMRPPCKVGDTVYYLNRQYHISLYKNTIYEAKVVRIVTTSLGTALVIHIRDESGCCEVPDIRDWGITVFATKEEAEQALKGVKK